jgi:hypothetical protein
MLLFDCRAAGPGPGRETVSPHGGDPLDGVASFGVVGGGLGGVAVDPGRGEVFDTLVARM